MKRFDPTVVYGSYGEFAEMIEDKDGDYMRYEDIINLLYRLHWDGHYRCKKEIEIKIENWE